MLLWNGCENSSGSLLSILLVMYPEVGLHYMVDHLDHFLRGSLNSPASPTLGQTLSAKPHSAFLVLAAGDWAAGTNLTTTQIGWRTKVTSPALAGPTTLPINSSTVLECHGPPLQWLCQSFTTPLKLHDVPRVFSINTSLRLFYQPSPTPSYSTFIIFALIIYPGTITYLIFFFKSLHFALLLYLWATTSRRSLLCYNIFFYKTNIKNVYRCTTYHQ